MSACIVCVPSDKHVAVVYVAKTELMSLTTFERLAKPSMHAADPWHGPAPSASSSLFPHTRLLSCMSTIIGCFLTYLPLAACHGQVCSGWWCRSCSACLLRALPCQQLQPCSFSQVRFFVAAIARTCTCLHSHMHAKMCILDTCCVPSWLDPSASLHAC